MKSCISSCTMSSNPLRIIPTISTIGIVMRGLGMSQLLAHHGAHQGGRGCACKGCARRGCHRGPEGQRLHSTAGRTWSAQGPAGEVGCLLDGSNIKLLILDRCSTYFAIVWQSKATDKFGDLICVEHIYFPDITFMGADCGSIHFVKRTGPRRRLTADCPPRPASQRRARKPCKSKRCMTGCRRKGCRWCNQSFTCRSVSLL